MKVLVAVFLLALSQASFGLIANLTTECHHQHVGLVGQYEPVVVYRYNGYGMRKLNATTTFRNWSTYPVATYHDSRQLNVGPRSATMFSTGYWYWWVNPGGAGNWEAIGDGKLIGNFGITLDEDDCVGTQNLP